MGKGAAKEAEEEEWPQWDHEPDQAKNIFKKQKKKG